MAHSDNLMQIPAVVLAGGLNDEEMKAATGVDNRAMVELADGKTMLDFVLSALTGTLRVGKIIVVGDVSTHEEVERLPSKPTFFENLLQGVNALPIETKQFLVVTSDIPFITSEAVDDFVCRSLSGGADFNYPIIRMQTYRQVFAGMKRTTLKLADGEFTGGNIMVLNASYVREHQQTILAAYAARKDVLKLGGILGWGLLIRVILSQTVSRNLLDIKALESGVSRMLGHGAVARAIVTEYASLGTDVDKPNDVAEARRLLAK